MVLQKGGGQQVVVGKRSKAGQRGKAKQQAGACNDGMPHVSNQRVSLARPPRAALCTGTLPSWRSHNEG